MKKLVSLILAVAMIFVMVACGGSSAPAASAPAASAPAASTPAAPAASSASTETTHTPITLQLSMGNTEQDAQGKAAFEWAKMLEEKNVGVTLEVFCSNQLGANADLMEQILMGEPMILLSDGSFLCEYGAKELGVLSMPYLFDTWDQCWNVIGTDWWKTQEQQMADNGVHLLTGNWIAGTRQIVCNRSITSLADMKGLKLRVPNNALSVAYFNAMGAAATPMSLSDVYTAIQQGLIDGQENPLEYCYTAGYYEICDYLVLSSHVNLPCQFVLSETVWNSMDAEQQAALKECGEAAGWICNDLYLEKESGYIDKFRAEGTTICEWTPDVVEDFRAAAAPAFEDPAVCANWQPGLREIILDLAQGK